ncbi:hypothetical protein [uncultured Tenacibaculum sp.]|uniref:hypothetical protein n=1 Tax=uncultured Tenacibaculum sp. TaxID=174713 RepID=UPI00260E7745|nr:hypothetical protein [uncultured Tenacibaculum sp.]
MITFVARKNLDEEKYNACVANSIQSNVFGFSWYLDQVTDNWSAFVLNDYEAVMPVPWKRKFFIKYAYLPFWILELGIFSKEIEDENEFLIEVFSEFKFVESRLNSKNSFSMFEAYQQGRTFQYISLNDPYEKVKSGYRRDRRKDLNRAKKNDLTEKWDDDPMNLINLYRDNVGKRVTKIKEQDYIRLHKAMSICIQKKVGQILSVYNKDGELIASGFFTKFKDKVSILASATNFNDRKNGANTFLIDRAIFKYQPQYSEFNFGGSSMKNIAQYFYSFGAKTENYILIRQNRLPKLLQIFKR